MLRRKIFDGLAAHGFLIGALICFALFSWYPIVHGILLSFQQVSFVAPPSWVGLANFRAVFTDPTFEQAWVNTAEFTGLALLIGFLLPFGVALALNEFRHLRTYFRLAVYLPVMLPPIVAVLLWKWFYDPGNGLFDSALRAAGLPTSQWLQSQSMAMLSLVLVATWSNMGTATLIYLAALQNIPGELYEAAELDGAGFWRRIRHVTLPQMRFVLSMLFLLQIVGTMQVFTEPFVMTGGGPDGATDTVMLLLYRYAFEFDDFGRASAVSVLLFLVLGLFSALYVRLSRTEN